MRCLGKAGRLKVSAADAARSSRRFSSRDGAWHYVSFPSLGITHNRPPFLFPPELMLALSPRWTLSSIPVACLNTGGTPTTALLITALACDHVAGRRPVRQALIRFYRIPNCPRRCKRRVGTIFVLRWRGARNSADPFMSRGLSCASSKLCCLGPAYS